jgi:hypothetical protein
MNRIQLAIQRVGVTAALLSLTVASACQVEGLAFEKDQRVEIISPAYRELLSLPVTVDWNVTDEQLADSMGTTTQFGVLVDIAPQPPGESLDYFARNDPVCEENPSCPDRRYLAQRGIHTTTDTEITFETMPIAPEVDLERGDPDFHDVTLILLNEDGERLGESAWTIIFEIERDES